jgi:hypothetical protein
MFETQWAATKAWLDTYTHLCLHELSTRLGLILTAAATVLPGFARFDVRIAYLAATAGVLLVLVKPGNGAPGAPADD